MRGIRPFHLAISATPCEPVPPETASPAQPAERRTPCSPSPSSPIRISVPCPPCAGASSPRSGSSATSTGIEIAARRLGPGNLRILVEDLLDSAARPYRGHRRPDQHRPRRRNRRGARMAGGPRRSRGRDRRTGQSRRLPARRHPPLREGLAALHERRRPRRRARRLSLHPTARARSPLSAFRPPSPRRR